MEPVRLERQHQVFANHRIDTSQTPEDEVETPYAAINLAESSDFPRLLVALALRPELAKATDAFGMTALHWVCSNATVAPRVVLTVARAHPEAAAQRNLAGQIPLHLAVRTKLVLEAIQALLHVYPLAIRMRTPDGKTALQLAKQHPEPSTALLTLLQMLENQVDNQAPLCSKQEEEEGEEQVQSKEETAASQSCHQEAALKIAEIPPPRWALASTCTLCAVKFGYFRKRHHCRSCGASVCGRHSRHRVPLHHLGLFQPQRVCEGCFDTLQKQLNIRAFERVTRAYPYINNDHNLTSLCAASHSMNVPSQHRRRSNSVPSEPIPCQGLSESCHEYTYKHETIESGMAASEKAESLQPTMGSMFLSVAPLKQTVLERQRLFREQPEQSKESERISRKSKGRSWWPHHSLAFDKTLHVQRLSDVDLSGSSDEDELKERMQELLGAHCELGDTVRCSDEEEAWTEYEKLELTDTISESGFFGPLDDEEDDNDDQEVTMAFFRKRSPSPERFQVAATHHKVGDTLLMEGNFMGAVVEFRRCVELDDENASAWLQLAKALDGMGTKSEAAEEAVRRALELEPASFGALSLLGKLLHLRGDHDDAILVFRQALKLQCPSSHSSRHTATLEEEPLSGTA